MDKMKVLLAMLAAGLMVAISVVQVSSMRPDVGRGTFASEGDVAHLNHNTNAAIAVEPMNPTAYVCAQSGEPSSLDPAVDYESSGAEVIQNVYQTLVWYDRESAVYLVPVLATEIPSIENGGISEDGMNYTFTIRDDVMFHDGTALTAEDVTYSIQRVLRMHDPDGPSWMIEQVMTRYLSYYIYGDLQTYIDDNSPPQWILDAIGETDPTYILTEDDLTAVAEASVTAIDEDTVNFRLTRPYPGFIQICASTVMSILSKDYVEANGGVVNGESNVHMSDHTCGTGPYELVVWEIGSEIHMTRFADYWGPAPPLEDVFILKAEDEEVRMSLLESGSVDSADVPIENESRFADSPDFTIFKGLPAFGMTFAAFNFNVDYTTANTNYGGDITADFFCDIHMRKAFTHLINYTQYIENVNRGNAIQPNGVIPEGMFGYDASIPKYTYDLAAAQAELEQTSWWTDGFTIPLFYNAGNVGRQTVCELVKGGLESIEDGRFTATITALDWPVFLDGLFDTNGYMPFYLIGWGPDYADPDDYTTPMLDSAYGTYPYFTGYQNESIDALVRQAAGELDETARADMYAQISQLVYEDCPYVWLTQANNFHVEWSWVEGYYFNPMYGGLYYAVLDKIVVGTEPHAEFTITPSTGDTNTLFEVNATGSSDLEDAYLLEYRWDWEGDGIWDTDWSLGEVKKHQYLVAGTYTVVLEVRDTSSMIDSTSKDIVVTDVAIPEFTTALVPVVTVLALFVVAMRKRRTS